MATLTAQVPDEIRDRALQRLAESQTDASLEEYIASAVYALALDNVPLDAETEAKVLEGLRSPARKMSAEDWDRVLADYDAKHGTCGTNGDKG